MIVTEVERKESTKYYGVLEKMEESANKIPKSAKSAQKSRFCRSPQLCCGDKSQKRLVQQILFRKFERRFLVLVTQGKKP